MDGADLFPKEIYEQDNPKPITDNWIAGMYELMYEVSVDNMRGWQEELGFLKKIREDRNHGILDDLITQSVIMVELYFNEAQYDRRQIEELKRLHG